MNQIYYLGLFLNVDLLHLFLQNVEVTYRHGYNLLQILKYTAALATRKLCFLEIYVK